MNHTQQRQRLRKFLAGDRCLSPASVYDPLSALAAQAIGYELGLLAGSVVSSTTLAAPDILLHTATEYAQQVRRIMRVSSLSLFVDADHGYGNALNVMRTVQELEHAGVSGLSIEDTAGPMSFGAPEGAHALVSIPEAVGKLRAALAARSDPALVIIGRTPALKQEGIESALSRVRAFAAAGVDAIHLAGGAQKIEHVQAIHAATGLPIIAGWGGGVLKRDDLARCGARILLQGHQPVEVAVKALLETYRHFFEGGDPDALKARMPSADEMTGLLNNDRYRQYMRDYLR